MEDLSFLSRLFYFGMHFLSILTLGLYDNPLRRMIFELQWQEPSIFMLLIIVSAYMFMTAGKSQQIVAIIPIEQVSIEITEYKKIFEDDENQNKDEEFNIDNKKTKTNQQFCHTCNILMNYRTKHCKICQKCIPKFDHHCYWLGGCIGELNYRKFYIYLLFQSLCWVGMDLSPYKKIIDDQVIYSQEYGAFFTLSVILGLLTLFTGGLLIFHSYLIVCGVTTWEYSKRSRISYLKQLPDSYNPFDEGVWGNIRIVFFHKNKLQNWIIKPQQQQQQQNYKGFNYFSNKYYSCC